ncbi:MAG TPA: hypothetical protein VF200_11915 [Woeseiaceae bacterium]
MKRFFTLFVFAALAAGCATAPKLSPEIAGELSSSNVAAAFYLEGKKINYDEMVYKVLWNENRSQASVFEGSWDVDSEVTAEFSDSLASIGLASRPIFDVLPEGLYDEFVQTVLNTRGADGYNVPMSMDSAVRDALLQNNIDYVILLRAASYQAQKVTGFAPQFTLPSLLLVYDVRRNVQQYDGVFLMGGKIAVEESPREVEANGLAKLKTATNEWIHTATATALPEALGLDVGS